jgi:hypothetical protein
MTTVSIRFLTLTLLAAPLCLLGCGSSDTGGSPAAGGTIGMGGTSAHGGTTGSGGTSATGGASKTGGATASGGSINSGGTSATGGASKTGGATGSGGSATGGTTGGTNCTIDTSTVTAANYPKGLTLTKACSPYMLDEIHVNDGGVLTIEAGATLKFSSNTAIYVGETGTGKLLANGTTKDPITMTTQSESPDDEGWYGLEFFQGATGSKVAYTTMLYAGGNFDAAIVGEAGMPKNSVTLDHVAINNLIDSTAATGIQVADSTSSFVVTSCTLDGAPYTP